MVSTLESGLLLAWFLEKNDLSLDLVGSWVDWGPRDTGADTVVEITIESGEISSLTLSTSSLSLSAYSKLFSVGNVVSRSLNVVVWISLLVVVCMSVSSGVCMSGCDVEISLFS